MERCNVIEIENLKKAYKNFELNIKELDLPEGKFIGLIGENGAGKTTLIKLLLNLIERNSGEIKIFGQDNRTSEIDIKNKIGVIFESCYFPSCMNSVDIEKMMCKLYKSWDTHRYLEYLARFDLPPFKKIREYSRGMKLKLNFAVVLAYEPDLIILDEATSGLDPIIRNEILAILTDIVTTEGKSVLLSTHIISDLEKVADYLTFIHDGNIIFSDYKDNILNSYIIARFHKRDKIIIPQEDVVASIYERDHIVILTKNKLNIMKAEIFKEISIEDIMLLYVKGVNDRDWSDV